MKGRFDTDLVFVTDRWTDRRKIIEAWMCSEFGMLITDVERERVKAKFGQVSDQVSQG